MEHKKKPDWLKVRYTAHPHQKEVTAMLRKLGLNTVCEEAACPNRMECFGSKTATFMLLGSQCTRNCKFCNVEKGETAPLDEREPDNVAEGVQKLGLKYVVLTSVTRDDLADGGSTHFAKTIEKVHAVGGVSVEVLIPDFQGSLEDLRTVVNARPEVINHNIETVPRLYPTVRPMAIYERSLELIARVKELDNAPGVKKIYTKSGIMVGLGETQQEVLDTFLDLRKHGCDILTVGQYLAPTEKHHPVVEYITPEMFDFYKQQAEQMGFVAVASAPLVRSSWHAKDLIPLK